MRGAGAFLPCREVFPEETEGVGDMLGLVVVQHPVQSLEGMGSLGVGGHGPVERIKVASLEGDHALSIHEAQRDDGLELRKDAGIVDDFLLCQGASCKDEEGNENDECSFSHDNLYIFCKVLYTFCLVMGQRGGSWRGRPESHIFIKGHCSAYRGGAMKVKKKWLYARIGAII